MVLIWVFCCNIYNISNRLVNIAENRQKVVKTRQKAVKIPPTAAPILTKCFVLHPCYICELHTKFQVFSLDRHTHGPMAETLDLGSRDIKTCFGTKI
jgi:hypothetical protein